MADLMTIRAAIIDTLEAGIPGLKGYKTIPENALVLPAVVVQPLNSDFTVAFGRGTDESNFVLLVLVSYNHLEVAQTNLDPFVSGSGEKSIRQCIWNNRSLGIGADAHIGRMYDYGMRFEGDYQGRSHEQLGARLSMTVYTKGDA